QDRWADRGADDGAGSRAPRLQADGRLHGGDLALDGARDAGRAARPVRRPRWAVVACARSRAWAALRREPRLSGDAGALGLTQRMIPKKPAPDLIRGGHRFPAYPKPLLGSSSSIEASAGEGRSGKIMRP